jgi:hypothetical protein
VTPGEIDVLLATGRVTVEHDNEFRSFRHHTSMLTALLETTGRFRVRVLEEFRGVGDELLSRFDVVLVMYEGRDDYHSVAEGFGSTTEQALLRFVRDEGRGIVWFHGSSVQEPDWGWPGEFDRMRGATLSRETGLRPRPQGEVVVRTAEPRHPITEGLEAEWAVVNDDVLTGARMDPSAQVLLTRLRRCRQLPPGGLAERAHAGGHPARRAGGAARDEHRPTAGVGDRVGRRAELLRDPRARLGHLPEGAVHDAAGPRRGVGGHRRGHARPARADRRGPVAGVAVLRR